MTIQLLAPSTIALARSSGHTVGDGGEHGSDHPRGVLAGDEHGAEHAEHELAQVHAAEAHRQRVGPGGGIGREGLLAARKRGEQRAEEHEHGTGGDQCDRGWSGPSGT